jgi:hypothetical protein
MFSIREPAEGSIEAPLIDPDKRPCLG